ncbi:MAG: D-alanyl-D-alanine carboxypeptidase/D-alanyl-D-alanine-endopeptidase [Cyanobacteria bacterium P01_H01_bin.162]
MDWRKAGLSIGGSFIGAITAAFPAVALCPVDLPAAMEAIAQHPELARARVGIQIETLDGESVYSWSGDHFFVPASTLKLVTTAAVLTELGPDYRIRTAVLGMVDGAGRATLQVVGRGDPSFDQSDLADLASQVSELNVRQVDILYGDDRAFAGEAVNPNWEWEDVQAGYGAPVNALILEENEIGLSLHPQAVGQPLQVVWDVPSQGAGWTIENTTRTVAPGESEFVSVGRDLSQPVLRVAGQLVAGAAPEPVAIAEPNPGPAFLNALQTALSDQGIEVQQIRLGPPPSTQNWGVLAVVQSPSLAELLIPTNQNSNNLYAEALLKMLGRRRNPSAEDATAGGIAIALNRLQMLGLDPADVVMVDGSGLARKNLITPAALVDVLQIMARSPQADVFRESLAVAGQSGTLRHRWLDTPVEGQLSGKSGAISRNFALAGYLQPERYSPVAFTIFLNNIDAPGRVARSLIDEMVLVIAALEPCE